MFVRTRKIGKFNLNCILVIGIVHKKRHAKMHAFSLILELLIQQFPLLFRLMKKNQIQQ